MFHKNIALTNHRPTAPVAQHLQQHQHHQLQQPQTTPHIDLDHQIDVNNNTSSPHHLTISTAAAAAANTTPNASFTANKSEKYSLRQRHKRTIIDDDNNGTDDSDCRPISRSDRNRRTSAKRQTTASVPVHHAARKIGSSALKTGITTDIEVALITPAPVTVAASKKKSKPKAAPLSKYRRKTANARERTRMREINSAFENLRKFVPLSFCDESSASTNEKLTKITTLRLAMKYIQSLNDVLHYSTSNDNTGDNHVNNVASILSPTTSVTDHRRIAGNEPTSDSDTSSDSGSLNCARSNIPAVIADVDVEDDEEEEDGSIGYGLTLNEDAKDLFKDLLMTAYGSTDTQRFGKIASNRNNSNNNKGSNLFGNTHPQHYQNYQHNKFGNGATTNPEQHHANGTNINKNGVMFNDHQPYLSATSLLHDIGLMFESDGESLHLSEPGFSPASAGNQQNHSSENTATAISPPTMTTACNSISTNHIDSNNIISKASALNALEFGGLLADSDNDSLELTEPCLSPLAGLDVLGGPFSDLMMQTGDFGEHQHLEMYLT